MTKKDMELMNLRTRVEDQRKEINALITRVQIYSQELDRKCKEIDSLKRMLDEQIRQNQFLSGRM